MTALVFIPDYIQNKKKKKEDGFPNKQYLFIISCQETVQYLREMEGFFLWLASLEHCGNLWNCESTGFVKLMSWKWKFSFNLFNTKGNTE